jgi:cytochrome P450
MVRDPAQNSAVDQFLNNVVHDLYTMAKSGRGAVNRIPVEVISDTDSVHAILSQPARFTRSLGLLGSWGNSRFNANGVEWDLRRALTQRAYLSAGADENAHSIRAIYEKRIAVAECSLASIQRALMLAATESFFAAFDCRADCERLFQFFERAREHVKRLQFFTWHAPSVSETDALRDEANRVSRDFEREVRSSPTIQELIASFSEQAANVTGFDPFHELLMNFFAAIETTAATLCFAIDRLGTSAMVQKRLHDEILQGKDVYSACFIQETLRYFPAIPFVVREATEETKLGATMIGKRQPFLISIVGLHHDKRRWTDPDVFDTSRMEFLTNNFDRRSFLPFLAGPRMCGGAKLARLELNEGLRAFIRRFETKNDSEEVGFDYGITLRPRALGNITFYRRP